MSPRDAALYARVKADAKRRFKRWPSAYGSAWLVREYKRRGGTYHSKHSKRGSKRGSRGGGVAKWMREEWVQVLPALAGRTVACGRGTSGKACRPRKRVDARTPPTLDEVVRAHGRSKVRSLARRKARDMDGRISWKRGTFTSTR